MDELTADQLNEWEAYDKIEQIGEYRQDYRIASLSSLIYNVASSFGGSKGKRHISKPKDFMYWLDERDFKKQTSAGGESQSVEQMKAVVLGIASSAKKKGMLKTK